MKNDVAVRYSVERVGAYCTFGMTSSSSGSADLQGECEQNVRARHVLAGSWVSLSMSDLSTHYLLAFCGEARRLQILVRCSVLVDS